LGRHLGGTKVIPDEPVSYRPIGVVRNHLREPRPGGWEDVRSDLILREELVDALDSLDGFSHVIVVFHMNQVPAAEARHRVPVAGTERGVLATRSQLRPNPIGVAVVPLIRRRENILRVVGLDATDGTPVLDIKPYLPPYDAVPDATLPGWATGQSE
jgi:tRNA-Thr(GGU) m(6)t(6)A37 methyltransferase TsaA